MSILFQNIPQLQNRYPDNQWEEILGGCDFSIFLGCNDITTASYYSDRTGEITVSVSSTRKNYHTMRVTDYVPEYSESTSLGKRMLLLPDEILRYPLDQGLLIIRGQKVCRFRKMDYLEHPDSNYLTLEKVEAHIPDWYQKEQEEKKQFQIFEERERAESRDAKEIAGNEPVEETVLSQEIVFEENFPENAVSAESDRSVLKEESKEEFVKETAAKEPEPPLAVDTPVKKRERIKPTGKQQEGARITKVEELFADHTSGRKEEL